MHTFFHSECRISSFKLCRIWYTKELETLDEAIEEANEAAYNWISLELDEDDCQLPPVSDEDDLELEDGDIVRNISVNIRFYEGWDE